jgi:RNA polymerase sigma-70 factor (ECF subfamily)
VEDRARAISPADERLIDADARLLEQIRSGEVEAGHRFIRDHYRAIYRYLLYLSGRPDWAEDLTQETFLQGWRRLETFQGRGSLRSWLLRIAHREFLHGLQRGQAELGLEGIAEVAAPGATDWMESVELRDVIDRLPLEQREVVLLHYLEGYSSAEIARIVDAPIGTICYRLARAREQLRQELGEDDLTYLNEPLAPMRQSAWLPLDQIYALETRLARERAGKRQPPQPGARTEESMERREFLRHAVAGAAGLMLPETDKEIVDSRLTQKVTLGFKGTALADLCERLRGDTGVHVTAGPSVADEKVTLFCEKLPLREVMRQLSRPFGYTWLRSGKTREYRYELVQDLRSQLLEEELRNREHHAGLLALEQEMQRLRPYLHLTPEEILARAKTAPPNEKKLLEKLGAGANPRSALGWGPIQMYFRLSRQELAALRAGEVLYFSEGPREGERPLPPDVSRGILRGWRMHRLMQVGGGIRLTGPDEPDSVPVGSVPGLLATCCLNLDGSVPGQYGLYGCSGFYRPDGILCNCWSPPYVVGKSPAVHQPDNAKSSARFAAVAALRPSISLEPRPSCLAASALGGEASSSPEPRVTSADVLEALHHATGLPLVADYYTRFHKVGAVSAHQASIYDALNPICDEMRLRWQWEVSERPSSAGWLQFRSTSYYHDKLKEVPHRLLTRWAAARRRQGMLTLDDLVEIGRLTDEQLMSSAEMAEGAKECFGLAEWDLVTSEGEEILRNLRFLAGFTPELRQEAMSPNGLLFAKMPLAQQQAYLARVFAREVWGTEGLQSLEDLNGASVRIDYSQPGWYEWQPPGPYWLRWVVPYAKGPQGKRAFQPRVRERTREAALAALRRVHPEIRAAVWQAAVRADPRLEGTSPPPDEEQIVPTKLDLATIYMPDTANKYHVLIYTKRSSNWPHTW